MGGGREMGGKGSKKKTKGQKETLGVMGMFTVLIVVRDSRCIHISQLINVYTLNIMCLLYSIKL